MTVLRAGTGRADITPPCGMPMLWEARRGLAIGIHDPLLAQALVLDDGQRQIALITLDLVTVSRKLTDDIRARVTRLTNIPADAVLVNASHTHSGPPLQSHAAVRGIATPSALDAYAAALPDMIAGTVYSATRHLRPAQVGASTGRLAGVSTNRFNRDHAVDDVLSVLRVDDLTGKSIAAVISFACHPTSIAGHNLLWNADFPSAVRATVYGAMPGSACLFLQGCAGDIAPWDFWFGNPQPRRHTFETRDALGAAIAGAALKVLPSIELASDLQLSAESHRLALRRRRLPWDRATLSAAIQALPDDPAPEYPETWPDELHTVNSAQRRPLPYQRHALALYADIMDRQEEPIDCEIQGIGIGPIGIVGNPFRTIQWLRPEDTRQ